MWVLFIRNQGCAGLSKGEAGLLGLELTFCFWSRISGRLGYPDVASKVSLWSSATIRPFPKTGEEQEMLF